MLWTEKYRPAELDGVRGQDAVLAALDRLGASPDMPHLLLHGAPGSGKTAAAGCLVARMFADQGRVLSLNASDERNIRTMRDTVTQFARAGALTGPRAPDRPAFKVVLLDEADSLTAESQSCLQALMEVHAARVRFVLTCNYADRLSAALRSRCVQLRFGPLPDDVTLGLLRRVCELEGLSAHPESLAIVCRSSGGDLRRALTSLQCLSDRLGDPADVALLAGRPLAADVAALVAAARDAGSTVALAATLQEAQERRPLPLHVLVDELLLVGGVADVALAETVRREALVCGACDPVLLLALAAAMRCAPERT